MIAFMVSCLKIHGAFRSAIVVNLKAIRKGLQEDSVINLMGVWPDCVTTITWTKVHLESSCEIED